MNLISKDEELFLTKEYVLCLGKLEKGLEWVLSRTISSSKRLISVKNIDKEFY
jgi:hypothetical protein